MLNQSTNCDISVFEPRASVFVAANAGAGKTSLLTKRVLSLLLSGISPSRILCLTFTNAAAAEMSARVLKTLGSWVMMDETTLSQALAELLGYDPDARQIAFARSLFANVLESAEGVRIQTIHGFCQSLLKRFPIEAGISPHFTVMDRRTEEAMLHESRIRLFTMAQGGDPALGQAIEYLAREASETTLQDVLSEIIAHKRKFARSVSDDAHLHHTLYSVWQISGLAPGTTEDDLVAAHFSYDEGTLQQLKVITALLAQGKKDDKRTAGGLARWLMQSQKTPAEAVIYTGAYLKADGDAYQRLYNAGSLTDAAHIEALAAECERVKIFNDAWRSLQVARRSESMFIIAHALLALYESLKQAHARMDFDDLILTAASLLKRQDIAPWVLYKLDGGIDHVLVDEAQDTSPEQWVIIKALTEEFFAGEGGRRADRSIFIVGDEKQSIYRFQGADVQALGVMQNFFAARIRDAAGVARHVSLNKSYRSLPAVLTGVDAVFSQATAKNGLTLEDIPLSHVAHRQGHEGLVELWPLIGKEEAHAYSPISRLVKRIADQIEHWVRTPVMLESKGRAVEPGDIMVLVRRRTAFVDKLARALKRRGIPVAGADRMKLSENLAAQDLVALGQFLLLPQDDLTLACVLKSPITNIDEDTLFRLAHGRGDKSLWERLEQESGTDEACAGAHALLVDLRAHADYMPPYELYVRLLDVHGARRRFTGRMGQEYADPIDEFLSQALLYEQSHTPSLQGFIHWLQNSESEIKRDMEAARGMVRIMTVHGAKGLQAPIVILPDTVEMPGMRDKILWHEESGLAFWPGDTGDDNAFCRKLREEEKDAIHAEYRRQLYVAMTRAEDRLYICGASGRGENAPEGSWFSLMQSGLEKIATPLALYEGTGLRVGEEPASAFINAHRMRVYAEPETKNTNLAFLHQHALPEPEPSKPISPSRLPDDAPAAISPLTQQKYYSRGKFVHSLLQYLPSVASGERAAAAEHLAGRYRAWMDAAEIEACIREASAVMAQPESGFIFEEGSLAEVPVAGVVEIGGKPYSVSGQIDRLCIGKEVWIVDYKTGRMPAVNDAISRPYLRQMTLYKRLLTAIYPQKPVHCAILWTEGPRLTRISEALLDEMAFGSYIQ